MGEISDELREIIRYLDDGTVSGAYSRELEDAVNQIKSSEERRHEYMIMMVRERELIDQGIERGRIDERVETIRKLIRNMHVTPQQAMSYLDIPDEEQAIYLEKIENASAD